MFMLKMQLVMIAAAQWFLYYNVVCMNSFGEDSTISNTLAALVGSNTCWLRNCPVPGTKTFGPLPLLSVVSPI